MFSKKKSVTYSRQFLRGQAEAWGRKLNAEGWTRQKSRGRGKAATSHKIRETE